VMQVIKEKRIVIILAVLLVISLAANGVLAAKLMRQPEDPSLSLYDPEYAVGRDEQTVIPAETTEPAEVQELSDRYITLVCPSDLSGRINVATTEQEDGVSMAFSGLFDGKEVELFVISLTKAESEDYILGEFRDENDGKFQVVMRMNEIYPQEWPEDVYNEICALQERVNDIIIQFYEDERFTPSR